MKVILQDGAVQECSFDDEIGREAFRHTTSHILAQAVKRLYPTAKCAIGPAIKDGFYYDFEFDFNFTDDCLPEVEAEMRKIIKENLKLTHFTMDRAEALKVMEEKGESYKVELINDLPEDATPKQVLEGVRDAVNAFVKDAEQFDDLTMLCLEYR